MQRTPVASSNIASIGYDAIQQILEIQFLNHPTKAKPGNIGPGDIYDYTNVSQLVYNGLIDAPSKGKYFYAVIQRGGYAYTKVFDSNTLIGTPSGATGISESLLTPFNLAVSTVALSVAPDTATPVAPTDNSSIGDIL